jgi:ABC-type spermidine/putrescine transport system permease subunit I
MVLPVTLTGCIIGSLPVLLLYPTLVVRFIIRHTLHLPTGTLIPNCMYTLFGLHCEDWSLACSAGLIFFWDTALSG